MSTSMRERLEAAVRYLWIAILLVFVLTPFLVTLLASLTPDKAIISQPARWFTSGFNIDNYVYILTGKLPSQYEVEAGQRTMSMVSQEIRFLPTAMLHSIIVSLLVMAFDLILGAPAAYALVKMRIRGKGVVLNFILGTRLIPLVAVAIPYYELMQLFKLTNTLTSLVIMYVGLTLPFVILILCVAFRQIDRAIEEAAQVDGLNPLQTLVRIVVPVAAPSIVGAGLFAFMLSYCEFLFGLLLATNQSVRTMPVTMASVSVNPDVSLGLTCAGIILGVLPALIVIVPVWRYMIRGLAEGATK
ncbi:multiple sugar transport system permease protein [Mycoplana sp. BE70]|uniref:carbohydrate ABC transporter permease n=1 Tax=Mycoplana sp. BE70 TaxID=2817775 RepID=UPI00286481C7|nr:carbohydrate ABC transporter permease [Mycoplana sp. BE70]MDR6755416.1 multiple sugar transport system permease protein [Mycoplana sp. BE70]